MSTREPIDPIKVENWETKNLEDRYNAHTSSRRDWQMTPSVSHSQYFHNTLSSTLAIFVLCLLSTQYTHWKSLEDI